MNRSHFSCAALGLLVLGSLAPSLHAGSPPMITDDPETPAVGHWEINVGASTEKRPGVRSSELPLFDINYGLTDRIQLKFEVPYLAEREDGQSTVKGWGKSAAGLKWRYYDGGEHGTLASVYPQIEFKTPGSRSDKKGLVEPGSTFLLPFQVQREFGEYTVIAQVGREFRSSGDSWSYGTSVGRRLNEKTEVMVELAGEADAGLHRSVLTADVGLVVDLDEHYSLMGAVGRELHNHDEERASLVAYIGIQLRL